MRIYFAGYSLALTPGRMGEMVQAYFLEREFGLPFTKGAPIILAGRITGFFGALCISFVTMFCGVILPDTDVWMGAVLMFLVAGEGLLLFRCKAFGKWVAGRFAVLPFWRQTYRHIYRTYLGLYSLLSFRRLMVAFLLSVGYWLVECMLFYTVLESLSISADCVGAFFVLSISSIVGALSMMPGSIGALEGGVIGLLMYFYGTDYTLASAAVLLHRFFSTWLAFVLGILSLLFSLLKCHTEKISGTCKYKTSLCR